MKLLLRSLCLLLLVCGVSGFLGCASKEAGNSKTITVWHWMTDRQPALQELSRRYEAKTGIKVNFELYAPSDAYSSKVRAAAQGANLPDVFGILGEKRDFASFIKAGHVLDLTPYMDANEKRWRDSFFAKALEVNAFADSNAYNVKPGIYGVPIDITTIQMVYNKDLFKELGLNPDKPPQTFEEFIQIGQAIKAKDVQGLVSGWADGWLIGCLANNYAFNIMGKEKFFDTIKGKVLYDDPDWVKVFSIFKDMRESGILAKGIVAMINKTAEQLFANGKAVFAFNGSWCVNVYKGMNPDLHYAAMFPPKIDVKYPMMIWGGAGSSFMVNAHSQKKEEAVKFLEWFTDREQQAYLSKATQNIPANKDCLGDIPQVLAQFAGDMDFTTHPNIWDISESPIVTETFNKGIQSIIIGEKTPQQVASEVAKIKEREMAKKNN